MEGPTILEFIKFQKKIDKYIYELTFFVATSATAGSYVLSHVVELVPCTLCWYQRILMFPLPLILGAAVLRRDKLSFIYVLPLTLIGMAVSAYHSLLQWGVIVEQASTCSLTGPSCAEPDILWLGFLTIPFAAFLTFTAISALMYRSAKLNHKKIIHEDSKRPVLIIITVIAIGVLIASTLIRIFHNTTL